MPDNDVITGYRKLVELQKEKPPKRIFKSHAICLCGRQVDIGQICCRNCGQNLKWEEPAGNIRRKTNAESRQET